MYTKRIVNKKLNHRNGEIKLREEQYMEIQEEIERDIEKYQNLLDYANLFCNGETTFRRLEHWMLKAWMLEDIICLLVKLKKEYEF